MPVAKRGLSTKFPDPSRLDPEFLLMLSEPIEDVYEGIEHDLLVNLAAHFQGGARVPKKLIPGSAKWSAWMLAQIGALTKENMRIIAAYSGDASEATALAVETTVARAIDAVEPELAAAFVATAINAPETREASSGSAGLESGGFARAGRASAGVATAINAPTRAESAQRAADAYARQAVNRQNLVNTVLLNSSLKAYRETVSRVSADYERALAKAQTTLNRETGAVILGAKTRQQAISDAVKRMAADGLTGYTDRAGKQWSAQAYAAMDIRTTTANAARAAVQQRNEDYGNHLISVSSHPGARPLCAPYQGKVYSTDGSSGITTDLHGKEIAFSPLESTSYGQPAGLFGINCGHMNYPFIPGTSVVRAEKYDPEETARLYKESQQQRYLERRVRKAKTEADALDAAGDKEGAKAARSAARERTAELKSWCEDKKRDFYPERVRVVKPGEAVERARMNLQLFARKPDEVLFKNARFANQTLQDTHVRVHLREYPNLSAQDYVVEAQKLLQSPPSSDILRHEFRNGDIKKFRISTGDFVSGSGSGNIRTYFKPKNGLSYWEKKVREDEQRDD